MILNHTARHMVKSCHVKCKIFTFTETGGLLTLVTLSLLKSSERKYSKMFSYADFAGKLDFAS